MTNDPLKMFVVEYSMKEDATHIRSLRRMVANNLSNLASGLSKDYVPIGLFLTRDQADSFVFSFRQGLDRDAQVASSGRNWHRVRDIILDLLPNPPNNFD